MRRRIVVTVALLAMAGPVSCTGDSVPSQPWSAQAGGSAVANNGVTYGADNAAASGAILSPGAGSGGVKSSSTGASGGASAKGGKAAGSGAKSGSFSNNGKGSGGIANRGDTTSVGGNSAIGGKTGSGGAGAAAGGNIAQPPAIVGGSSGWASRYWDCCKPACGWKDNARNTNGPTYSCDAQGQSLGSNYDARNACEAGGTAYMCWNFAPWAVSDKLSYGFAAASLGNYVCGRCYQLQFTGSGHNSGNNSGAASLNGKTMIVQIINNGGVGIDQFDLLIPGGGVGQLNACTKQGMSDIGAQYGGFLTACNRDKNCVRQKCQSTFSNTPDLMAGCEWFLNWFNGADNPNFVFKQIACPAAITAKSGMQG